MTPAWCVVGLICGGVLIGSPLHAAEDPVDADLLEFLGSVDSNDVGWHDYLAVTDVNQLVKSAAAAAGASTAKPASTTGTVKQP